MSISWGKNFGKESREVFAVSSSAKPELGGVSSVAGATTPPVLSQNPVVPTLLRSCDGPGAVKSHADDRPDFWDFVYWAGWGLTGFLALVLAASVAKAIRYGVITDIINWMLGR